MTNVSDLATGDKVVIVANASAQALSTTQNGNNRGQTSVTKDAPTKTVTWTGSSVQVLTLEDGKTSGTWAFYTGSGYLYAASSSKNYLRTETTLSANSSWNITIVSTGVATIKATGTNTNIWLIYNSSNNPPIFSCYGSGQGDVCIYKKVTPVEPQTIDVTLHYKSTLTTISSQTSPYTLPTTGDYVADACDGWEFAGWYGSEYAKSEIEPSYITQLTSTGDAYAVYSKTETTQGGGGTEVNITPSGLSDNKVTHNQSSYTITTAKNGGQTAPAYNAKDADVRIYAKGSITISNTTNITKIVFNVSAQGKKRLAPITASVGSIATQTSGDATVTWTGEATSITFTVGEQAEYGSDGSGKAGQLCFTTITATTSGGGSSSTTYYHSTPDCGSTEPSQLAKPTGLNVTNITSSSATLSWDAVANANGYEIKKGNSLIVSTGATSSNLSGLEPSTEYTYCVYAVADGYTNSEETCVTFTTAPAEKVVNWNVKGTEHQTNFNGQSTAIYQPSGEELTCGEKKFVGWTATKNYENATNAPNDLFTNTLPGGVIESTTFYAVYADTRTTTSITYTWDLVKESTTPALATGDQIVIAAKEYDYALSTTQNTDDRGAVSVTKSDNSITIDNTVQIFTIEEGYEDGTFALATGNGYLSGTRRKEGRNYYNQLITAASKSANASWYIGFTEETTPYIYNEVSEKKNGNNYEYSDYDWWTGTYHYYFEAVRDASTWYDYNPENISIYRRTKHENTTTVNSGYTTDCGCTPPQTPLNIENSTVVVNKTLDLSLITYTGGTGGQIYQYYCSDAEHTTITDGYKFSATVLGDYEITATQATNNGACETTATFTVTVTCATPSITPTTYSTTINTPVDLKSIITSTSTMPLTFACTDENVYISGTNFTFLAAGDYTITATQEAGGIYCDGSQEITITVTDPCAGKIKPSVNEGTITTDGFTLSWSTIAGVSTYRIYNNTTGDSDETTSTTYTFSGLNPSTQYSWTVEAVYSDGCTAAASGTTTTSTPVVKYTVNWNVAGSGYNTGTPTTSVNHGEKVSDLPTTPNPAEHSCGDKVFVGWSKSQFVDGTRPADLFTDVAGSPVITAATTFYAVFADCVTDGGDDTPEDDTQGEWTLVTDVNDLQAGDKIIIACYSKEKAASELTSAILSVDADVTFSNSGNTLTPSASTLIFTLGGSTGAWTLANSNGQLLGATAVKKLAWDGGTTTWSISISGTEATISNTNNSYGRFLYNVGSPRFTTYTSSTSESMLLPQIYKKTGSGSGGGETPDPEVTITWMVNGEETIGDAPANPTSDCGTFIGWTTSEINGSSITQPATLYATANDCPKTNTMTYYAVFKITSGGGEGTTEIITFSEKYSSGETASQKTQGNVTISFSYGTHSQAQAPTYYSDGVRVYNGNTMTISSSSSNITAIECTFSNTNSAFTLTNGGGDYINTDNSGTWIGSSTSITLKNNTTSQIKLTEITVTICGGTTTYVTTCPGGSGGSGEGGGVDSNTEVFSDQLNFDTDGTSTTNRDGWSSLATAYSYKSGSQSGIRIASGSKAGSITTNPLTNVNGTNATLLVEFDAVGWDSGEKTLSVSVINGATTATTFSLNNSSSSTAYTASDHYSFTITGASSSTQVTWSAAADQRAIIANVVITQLASSSSIPAHRAAQKCTSYENYTTICCENPITDLKFAAGANSITLYWNTAATSATATLYNNEECTSQVTGATQSGITNGTCTFTGLAKTTTYYAKVTTADGCTAVLEVSTERPIVSVAEWAATQINIDINTNEPIQVFLENEVTGGSTSGNQATELFFSKYYEATANVKLVAVYNGTPDAINLSTYTIKYGKTAWATNYIPLAEFATTANGFAEEGYLSPGEEMILYTKNVSDDRDVAIMECVNEAYPDGKWIEVTTTNNTGSGSLSFGGDKTIALFKGGAMIDIIGGGTTSKPDNSGASTKPAWGDAKGWTCDEGLSIDDGTMIGISTNRCLLVRNNTVTSGENAVSKNTSDFVNLCTEWKGAHVPEDDIDEGVAASCENFAFVGTFDYSDYYVKYEELATSDELPADGRLEDGTYKVTTPDLHDIACTNMRISVKSATDGTTLVTQDYKVPIIVDEDISTNNPIYFQYTQRTDVDVEPDLGDKNENVLTPDICAECDIVIRDSKTLTHVAGGKGQFRNMMVYPNAKMDNQDAQPFNLNTLQMQGQNDAVSYAIIENDGSTIDVGDMVFVKRIDDKYWYNFSLPYDCKVADIIQQNGQSMGKYWVDWGIKEYDGKARQEGGNSAGAGNVGYYWKKVEETATLKAHQGYIIGLFTTEWTNQMKFVYFTPTNTNPYRESGSDDKTTTIDSWYTTNKATVAARHRGWNFTGSPYISRFGQSTDGEGLYNTSLIMTGYPEPENNDVTEYETYTENVYVTIPSTQGGKYYSHSVASGVQLLPFTAYFVQAADVSGEVDEKRELTYDKRGRAFPASAPARAIATKQRVLVELLVTAPDGQTDNTGVWVDERYTPEYEIAADLGKMYVAGAKPQLYTLAENGEMMAYHALPDACAMNIPLRLYAPKAGDYTLTLNQRVSRLAGAERIELLYNNAVVANMMLQDYTITANRGTVNGYSLSITRRADVSTAIDNITGTAITVIANDGYISVTDIPTDAQVSVYDMLGRLLTTQSANGQTVVNIPAVPQGVYNIVVGNNNGHTTIKTVIK